MDEENETNVDLVELSRLAEVPNRFDGIRIVDLSYIEAHRESLFWGANRIENFFLLKNGVRHNKALQAAFLESGGFHFTEEFLEEYGASIFEMRKIAGKNHRSTLRRNTEGKGSGNGNYALNKNVRAELRVLANAVDQFRLSSKNLRERITHRNMLEPKLKEVMPMYPIVLQHVRELAEAYGVCNKYHNGHKAPSQTSLGKDPEIFSKAFLASFDSPVYLCTSDSDFLRMSPVFYEPYRLTRLENKIGRELPQNPVNILFRNRDKYALLNAGDPISRQTILE